MPKSYLESHPAHKSWFRCYKTALAATWGSWPRFVTRYAGNRPANRPEGRFSARAACYSTRRTRRISEQRGPAGLLFWIERAPHCRRDSDRSREPLECETPCVSCRLVGRTSRPPRRSRPFCRTKTGLRSPVEKLLLSSCRRSRWHLSEQRRHISSSKFPACFDVLSIAWFDIKLSKYKWFNIQENEATEAWLSRAFKWK